MADNEVRMMMSVLPGAMTGFAALNSGLVSINNVFGAMTRSVDAQFGLINTAIMTTGVVVTQMGMDAMNAFGQFEQGMKIVQMVSGQTRADIDLLKQKANEFSVQYRMDIDQLTEGLQTLGRAGLNSASEQAEVLENGLYTAKLEGRDLNGVLEELIQTTALLGGNLKSDQFGEQSGYVENLMVATSMTAPITTHDVNETLKYSGGIAAAAGANIETEEGKKILEDYMGAIAAFAQKGVTGSIAGTALRAFFNKPATQDSSVTDALASINLSPESLWEEDEETMKPVSEQIGIIQRQMDDLNVSTMDRLQIWSKIVGGKMGQQMMKLNSDDIKELTKDIQSADNASSLAANSMKTYEANVKAIGESGALLQRNVGEKLVFFANPILDIINKVTSFLNQDFMSWPLTIGIMSFIALAARRLKAVILGIKAELSTLVQGLKQGLTYYTQKQGIVRVGDNPIDDQKERYKAYFKAKDEYYGRTPRGDKKSQKTQSFSAPTTLKDYDKKFSSQIKQTGSLTLKAFEDAGVSGEKIALAGRLSGLTSTKNSLGIPEGQLWATALKNNLLSQEQFNSMFKAYKSGVNPRPTADIVGIESVIPKIKACQQSLIDLGMSAEQARSMIWTEEERMAAEKFVRQSIDETTNSIIKQINVERDKEIAAEEKATLEQERTSRTKVSQEELSRTTSEAAAHTTTLGDEVKTTTQNIVMNVTATLSQVEAEFMKLARGVSLFNSIPVGANPYVPKGQVVGGYTPLPSNIHQMMGSSYVPHKEIEQRARELRANSLAIKDSAMRARAFEEAYKKPYIPEKTGRTKTDARIEAGLRGKRLENDFKEYDDAQAAHYQRLFNQHVNNVRSTYVGSGVGGVSGRLPTQEAIDASIKAKEEAEKANHATRISTLGAQAHAGAVAASNFQENLKKQGLANVQYGEAELEAHRQGVLAEEEILMKRRQAAESLSQKKYERDASTEKDRQKFQEQRTKGNLITTRNDIDNIRKQAKDDFNKHQRSLGTERDRQRFQEENRKSNMVSQSEAQRFRDQARNDVNYLKGLRTQSGLVETPGFQQALGKYGNQIANSSLNQQTSRILSENQDVLNRIKSNPVIVGTGYANTSNWKDFSGGYGLVGRTSVTQGFGSAFAKSFSDRINRDRTGSFLSFGSTTVNGVTRSATKGLSGLANKALNLSDAFGGPLMIAIMAVTTAIQMWQKAFQEYCEDLKEAGDKLEEAYSERDTAEDSLRKTFKEANPDATAEELDQMIYDTYNSMNEDMSNAINNGTEEWLKKTSRAAKEQKTYEYDEEKDDGSVKEVEEEVDDAVALEEAIKENTGALYVASGHLNAAMTQYVNKGTDSWWGVDGWTGDVTDALGSFQDTFSINFLGDMKLMGTAFGHDYGSKFTDNNQLLLTARQQDENYAGYKEMAGLMLEDFKDAKGDWKEGLRTMMGGDADVLSDIISQKGRDTLQTIAGKDEKGRRIPGSLSTLSPEKNLMIQQSMKNDQKTWKQLAKEIAKRDINKKANRDVTKNMQRISGLINRLNTSMGSNFSETQLMQAAYLQQMQDMYQVANDVIVPIINTNMQTAADTLTQVNGVGANSSSTSSSSSGTEGITSVIAGMVAQIAMAKAADATFNSILMQDPSKLKTEGEKEAYKLAQESSDGQEFLKKASSASYSGGYTSINWDEFWGQATKAGKDADFSKAIYGVGPHASTKAMDDVLTTYGAGLRMSTYGEDSKTSWDKVEKAIKEWRAGGSSTDDIYKSLAHITQDPRFQQQLLNAYLNSGEEEGGGGSGAGSGDDGDKDKDKGTKKERVDLVLCSKKEIPKLNVNLFKKPPTFTVLNKNFKVRDVKINTEDKPKAIMSAIKNSFIDVQKRSDPKIIQDEDAVYDPEGATDGNPLPSGSAKTKTD